MLAIPTKITFWKCFCILYNNVWQSHFIGEIIKSEESRLLGEILSKTNFLTKKKIDNIEQYIVENRMTYGEIQIMLSEDSTTLFLSENLKDKLQSSEF